MGAAGNLQVTTIIIDKATGTNLAYLEGFTRNDFQVGDFFELDTDESGRRQKFEGVISMIGHGLDALRDYSESRRLLVFIDQS